MNVVGILFTIFICVVLIENYGVNHNDKVILVDTCIVDTFGHSGIDTISIDSVMK